MVFLTMGRRVLVLLLAALAVYAQTLDAQTARVPEYQLKATFLFQFTQFVAWPSDAFASPATPLVIGILGDDPFGKYLDDVIQHEKLDEHPLTVQRFRRLEDVKNCHLLFVARTDSDRIEEIVDALKGQPVLTVGDAETFAERGGVIQFVTEENRTRLRINLDAAKGSKLTISSKLLRPARVINAGGS
jgi:hypothetical protein